MAPGSADFTPRTPIVVFGDDWGRQVSTMQHLFRQIAKDYPVVWVNGIGHRVPGMKDVKRAFQKARAMLRGGSTGSAGQVAMGASPLRVLHPRVLPWHHLGPVHAWNNRSLLGTIRAALAELELTQPPLLVTGTPPSAGIVGQLGEMASIYFCMDDFLQLPTTTPWMLAPLEERLLRKVDAVVATAESLTHSKRPASGRIYYLPQGVNYEHLSQPQPVPPDLADLPRPIIGFAGSIYDRCDFALLHKVAAAVPQGSVVLIGPVVGSHAPVERSNIHLMGQRPYQQLPGYVQAFDVGLIPYILNEETRAVDPLKLLEYLAAGVPVVTTDLPEVRKYSQAVAVAPTHDEFVAAVLRAVQEPKSRAAERQALASGHGWPRRAEELLRIFREVVSASNGGAR